MPYDINTPNMVLVHQFHGVKINIFQNALFTLSHEISKRLTDQSPYFCVKEPVNVDLVHSADSLTPTDSPTFTNSLLLSNNIFQGCDNRNIEQFGERAIGISCTYTATTNFNLNKNFISKMKEKIIFANLFISLSVHLGR